MTTECLELASRCLERRPHGQLRSRVQVAWLVMPGLRSRRALFCAFLQPKTTCTCPCVCMCTYVRTCVCMCAHVSACVPAHVSACVPAHVSACVPMCLNVCLPMCLRVCPCAQAWGALGDRTEDPLVFGIIFGLVAGMMVAVCLMEILPTAFK